MITLTGFTRIPPRREISQAELLAWLADAHADAETRLARLDDAGRARVAERTRRALARVACKPPQIERRGVSVDALGRVDDDGVYDLARDPHGAGTRARTGVQDARVRAFFDELYAREAEPPRDLIHVTCTGYASPSGAQRAIAARGWGARTRVTHAYHMGCYAALPAVRLAEGLVRAGSARVDVAHTELCSLHLDPTDHRLEALVAQSLFADGFIRYTLRDADVPGLRLCAHAEQILPGTADAMTWIVGDHGMVMTLARDVPERIAGALGPFVESLGAPRDAVFAIHPGGPRIIDGVAAALGLAEAQVAHSRAVLRDHGNMSSATLPHVWMRLAADPAIAPATPIVSLAFGPGLTIAGARFEKT